MKNRTSRPDFLIVGAAKSGTSSLHYYLSEHPEISMPKIKELNFWHTFNHEHERAILKRSDVFPKSIQEYEAHFSHRKPRQICGEASPSYLYYYKDTVDNLKQYKKDWRSLKIVIILREPLDKIWSHYKFSKNKRLDPDDLSLSEALNMEHERLKDSSLLPDLYFVDITKYYDQVKWYKQHFKNVKVLLYDDLKGNKQQLLNELTDFLGVSRFIPESNDKIFNASNNIISPNRILKMVQGKGLSKYFPKGLRNHVLKVFSHEEKMSRRIRSNLKNIFKPEVEKLNSIIDKDLSSWLAKYD